MAPQYVEYPVQRPPSSGPPFSSTCPLLQSSASENLGGGGGQVLEPYNLLAPFIFFSPSNKIILVSYTSVTGYHKPSGLKQLSHSYIGQKSGHSVAQLGVLLRDLRTKSRFLSGWSGEK